MSYVHSSGTEDQRFAPARRRRGAGGRGRRQRADRGACRRLRALVRDHDPDPRLPRARHVGRARMRRPPPTSRSPDVDDETVWGSRPPPSIATASAASVTHASNRAHAVRQALAAATPPSTACRRRWSGCQAGSPEAPVLRLRPSCASLGAEARQKVGLAGLCVVVLGRHSVRRTLAPKLDLEPLELLDQHQNRAPCGSYLLARVGNEPAPPPAERARASLRRNAPPSPRCANSRPRVELDHPHLVKSAGPGVSRRAVFGPAVTGGGNAAQPRSVSDARPLALTPASDTVRTPSRTTSDRRYPRRILKVAGAVRDAVRPRRYRSDRPGSPIAR